MSKALSERLVQQVKMQLDERPMSLRELATRIRVEARARAHVLTLNQETKTSEELTSLVREAMRYFPEDIWEGINYLGNLDLEYHVRIKANQEPRGAFIVNTLVERLRELKKLLKSRGILIGLTLDPIIVSYFQFDVSRFSRIINLVKDYVTSDVGFISLFDTDEETAIRISAHGLGHNQGLSHHHEPIDLMYIGLLDGKPIRNDGFCEDCQTKLARALKRV